MNKTWLITPAFCKAALLEECLSHIYRHPPEVEHVVIDNHYPVNKERNREEIKALCIRFGCTYVDSGRDLGLHEGINAAGRHLGFDGTDTVVGCDPDDRPSADFVPTLSAVMRADRSMAVLALNFWVIEQRISEGKLNPEDIAGHKVWTHPTVEMWTVAAFNWHFVTRIGGLKQHNAYYGGLESYLYGEWSKRGMRMGYLADVRADAAAPDRDNPQLFDPEYREWKNAHVAGFKGSFEEWLGQYKPRRL